MRERGRPRARREGWWRPERPVVRGRDAALSRQALVLALLLVSCGRAPAPPEFAGRYEGTLAYETCFPGEVGAAALELSAGPLPGEYEGSLDLGFAYAVTASRVSTGRLLVESTPEIGSSRFTLDLAFASDGTTLRGEFRHENANTDCRDGADVVVADARLYRQPSG